MNLNTLTKAISISANTLTDRDMTQIEFIRAEVEKLKGELPKQRGYKRNAYNHVLRIIDSAPKELPIDKLDELKRAWYEEGKIDGKFEGLSDDEKYQQGFYDAKEQMMKDAFSCEVDFYDGKLLAYTQGQLDSALERIGAKVGEKVKILIIKE